MQFVVSSALRQCHDTKALRAKANTDVGLVILGIGCYNANNRTSLTLLFETQPYTLDLEHDTT